MGCVFAQVPLQDGRPKAGAVVIQEPLAITLQQFLYRDPAQAPVPLDDAATVRPGDLVEYRATYRNQGQVPLEVVAQLPIPLTLVYEAGSARLDSDAMDKASNTGAHVQPHKVAQADAQFAREPLQKTIIRSDGATVLVPVPYADYRSVQWDLGSLPPGAQRAVRLRARVERAPPDEGHQVP